jgi:type VI secretion system protein ImpH
MNNLPHTFFGDYDNDFKAEVIAAEMVENGINADRILILLAGAMKRPFRTDVTSIEEELSDYDSKEYTIVKTTREGIYDMLPEGLFHHANAHKNTKTDKEIIKSIKQRRQEEVTARKFFLPFETTINYLRMQMALYENMLDKRSDYDELVKIFSDQWEIFQYLDTRQANIFLYLIPILHDLRDDCNAIETVFEMIFLLPVKIFLQAKLPYQPAELIISKLGDSSLGTDLTTGNMKYDEGTDEILIKIACSKNRMLQHFMPGGNSEKILQLLCDYLLPVHLDIITTYELDAADKVFRLADKESFYNSVLGEDTFL